MTNEQFLPTRIITMSRYRTQDEQRAAMAKHLRNLIRSFGFDVARKCREHCRYLGIYPTGIARRTKRGVVTTIDYV